MRCGFRSNYQYQRFFRYIPGTHASIGFQHFKSEAHIASVSNTVCPRNEGSTDILGLPLTRMIGYSLDVSHHSLENHLQAYGYKYYLAMVRRNKKNLTGLWLFNVHWLLCYLLSAHHKRLVAVNHDQGIQF